MKHFARSLFILFLFISFSANAAVSYCACIEGDTITKPIPMIMYYPFLNAEEGETQESMVGLMHHGFELQNEYVIHTGPCVAGDENYCAPDEEVSCVYLSQEILIFANSEEGETSNAQPLGNRNTIASFPNDYLMSLLNGFEVYSEGYCPCELVPPVCLSGPFDGPRIFIPKFPIPSGASSEAEETQNAIGSICMGEEITVSVTMNCGLVVIVTNPQVSPETTNPEELAVPNLTYKWTIHGFGSIVGPDDLDSVNVVDWVFGDYLIAEVMDENGCLSVERYNLISFYPMPLDPYWIIPNEEYTCISDKVTLCVSGGIGWAQTAEASEFEDDPYLWRTDGNGVFSSPSEQDGYPCIDVEGLSVGDKVVLYYDDFGEDLPDALQLSEDCQKSIILTINTYEHKFCNLNTSENGEVIGSGEGSLDDPCNCSDPMNVLDNGYVTYFHDILTVNTGLPGSAVTISNFSDWFINEALDTPGGDINMLADANGQVFIDFWHEAGVGAEADVNYNGMTERFISSVCQTCRPIPTVGQWGLIVIALLAGIFGVITIREKVMSKNLS